MVEKALTFSDEPGKEDAYLHDELIRNSRLYFLPHGSGISTGHVAPMAL